MKTVVILHGWGGNSRDWQPLKNKLIKPGWKILTPSLPSDKARNTADYVSWLKTYTKNFPKIILIGHSFGGQIAIQFTAQYPQKVARLILINSAGIRNKTSIKRMIFIPLAKISKYFISNKLKLVFYRFLKSVDYYQASPIMKQTLKNILTEDQQVYLEQIIRPTLIIWGKHDTYTPLRQGRLIHQLIKSSTLKIVKDGKHGLHYTHVDYLVGQINHFIHS